MTDRERCLAEIARCEGVACPGAALGWLDWNAELLEIEREMKAHSACPKHKNDPANIQIFQLGQANPLDAQAASVASRGVRYITPQRFILSKHSRLPLPIRRPTNRSAERMIGEKVDRLIVIGESPKEGKALSMVCRCVCGAYCQRSLRVLKIRARVGSKSDQDLMCDECNHRERLKLGFHKLNEFREERG